MNRSSPFDNPAKRKLAGGGLVLCLNIRQMRTADAAMIVQACGFDVVVLDREHSPISAEMTSTICVAALGLGVTPLVRVASHAAQDISGALDGGAQGVIVPHVNDGDEAAALVRHAKYPPLGHRSVAALGPASRYQPPPLAESLRRQNEALLLVAMLETPAAIANADTIAAVAGIDALLIGSVDLSAELGVPGQLEHELLRRSYATVANACRAHGKHFAIAGGDRELKGELIAMGARLVIGGMDFSYLIAGARQEATAIRAMIAASGAGPHSGEEA
jgi:2-keto-3-deoxy-L-rhamnonate aldolase RhmA